MFSFKPKQPEFKHAEQPGLPPEWAERMQQLEQHLIHLGYQNEELRRTLTRMETKISKLGIALGCADAVTRSKT